VPCWKPVFPASQDAVVGAANSAASVGESLTTSSPRELLRRGKDQDKDFVVRGIIRRPARDKGEFGDGKIFITPVLEAYTSVRASGDGGGRKPRGHDMKEVLAIVRMNK
jgi:nitrogen regulatory protein PII 1